VADNLARVEFPGEHGYAQAGALLAQVSRQAAAHSLRGLEFAVGIPGTIGGGVIMNAGAYGGEMKDIVTQVRAVDLDGELHVLPAPRMEFAYRSSALQGRGWIVVDIDMGLAAGDAAEIRARMDDYTRQRTSKQPLELPSAGSVFKRPPGAYVGPMVEGLGLKGYRIGGAMVSEKHAGFIVNCGGATAADVLALIEHVRGRVRDEFGVTLETEVRLIGEDGPPSARE
ncbi:MAG TPA: UDP-N-acetylmuramate dehydrogenase, partial [bacterium]